MSRVISDSLLRLYNNEPREAFHEINWDGIARDMGYRLVNQTATTATIERCGEYYKISDNGGEIVIDRVETTYVAKLPLNVGPMTMAYRIAMKLSGEEIDWKLDPDAEYRAMGERVRS